jgi:hypothetical protein
MHQPERLVQVGSVEVVATVDDLARLDVGDGAAASMKSLAVGLTSCGSQWSRPRSLRVPLDDDDIAAADRVDDVNAPVGERGFPALTHVENFGARTAYVVEGGEVPFASLRVLVGGAFNVARVEPVVEVSDDSLVLVHTAIVDRWNEQVLSAERLAGCGAATQSTRIVRRPATVPMDEIQRPCNVAELTGATRDRTVCTPRGLCFFSTGLSL